MHAQVVQVNLQSGLLPTLNELISSECLPVGLCHYLRHLYFNVVSLLHWSGYKTCVSGCVCWVLAHRTPAATSRCLGHILQYFRNLPLSLLSPHRILIIVLMAILIYCKYAHLLGFGSATVAVLSWCNYEYNHGPEVYEGYHAVLSFQALQQLQQQHLEVIFMTGITLALAHFLFLRTSFNLQHALDLFPVQLILSYQHNFTRTGKSAIARSRL